jgi:hypothetical protein
MLPQDRYTQLTPLWYLKSDKKNSINIVYLQLPMNSQLRKVVEVCSPFLFRSNCLNIKIICVMCRQHMFNPRVPIMFYSKAGTF